MLIQKINDLSYKSLAHSEMLKELENLLSTSTTEEFLDLMFNSEAINARNFIESFLDEYDERRNKILQELANYVPEEHKQFFIHAFSRRIPEDDF